MTAVPGSVRNDGSSQSDGEEGSGPGLRPGGGLAYASRACLRDALEPPAIANGRHQQQPVNLKLAPGFEPRGQRT
jgi:hypothetical protein